MPKPGHAMKPTERTLREHMHLTGREIARRRALLDFGEADARALRACRPFVAAHLDGLVGAFFDQLTAKPDVARFIGDSLSLGRLAGALRAYILEMFDGAYDGEYVDHRLRVGQVHRRIGVPAELYVSGLHILQTLLVRLIEAHSEPADAGARREALHKVLLFDTQFVFDTYISALIGEVESVKRQIEDFAHSLDREVAARTHHLEELLRRDSLTGLWNHKAFYEHLRRDLAAARRLRRRLCLVYLDLNGFKELNDGRGHTEGDRVLAAMGEVMLSTVREADLPCRYGGDEFCIVVPNTTLEEATSMCRRLIGLFSAADRHGVTFSVGVAETGPDDFLDVDALVKKADRLMYEAKAESRRTRGFSIRAG
jgi:diguanylate cyclase (GGDEF)-like protein